MLDAINHLSNIEFVLFIIAVFCSLIQLGMIVSMATRGGRITVTWGLFAIAAWITLFVMTH